MAKAYKKTFYRNPCFINGCPPKMIGMTEFCTKFYYTPAEVKTLMRNKHVFALTLKSRIFLCPNYLSHLWSDDFITEFWGDDWRDRIVDG